MLRERIPDPHHSTARYTQLQLRMRRGSHYCCEIPSANETGRQMDARTMLSISLTLANRPGDLRGPVLGCANSLPGSSPIFDSSNHDYSLQTLNLRRKLFVACRASCVIKNNERFSSF